MELNMHGGKSFKRMPAFLQLPGKQIQQGETAGHETAVSFGETAAVWFHTIVIIVY
jgi:hypothetical protein